MRKLVMSLCVAAGALMSGCNDAARSADATEAPVEIGTASVNADRLLNADKEPGSWLSAARTYDEQRFSPLDQINDTNVKQLGLSWYADIDTERGQESTPIIVDGVMYLTTAWSMVKAYDIKTGAQLWAYDPAINREKGNDACCDVVNRGVAAWNGKIIFGSLDGRLIALDGKTGKVVTPQGSAGHRWDGGGKWNLEQKDQAGNDAELVMTLVDEADRDAVVPVHAGRDPVPAEPPSRGEVEARVEATERAHRRAPRPGRRRWDPSAPGTSSAGSPG